MSFVNNIHDTIKFTVTYSKVSVSFLDVNTYFEDGIIKTNLFVKDTDSHTYLDYGSCHPESIKNSIPFSQFLRVRRNCTDWADFVHHSLRMQNYFSLRGYPMSIVDKALTEVNKQTQTNTLVMKIKDSSTDKLFCIVDFNLSAPNIKKIITKYWPLLDRSSATRSLVDMEIVFGFRKPRSISDIICNSDICKPLIRIHTPKCKRS